MASKIPIRRPRTIGAENENARPTARTTAKPSGFGAGRLAAAVSSKPEKAVASASTANSGGKTQPTRAVELAAVASAKRKRHALQELSTMRNRTTATGNGGRKILALPKKSAVAAAMATVATVATARASLRARAVEDENSKLPQVFVPPPRAEGTEQLRRLSSRPSLIPVRQREKEVEVEVEVEMGIDLDADDDEEPLSKRARTSSVGPEDEQEVAAELDAYTDDEQAEPRADAEDEGDACQNLDAADHDDPTMASEYVADIQRYLREAELHTLPSPAYMSAQPTLTWAMRALLNDWLLQVHTRFRLLPETLFLCANLTDRFLSLRAVSPSKLQLVGMVCLLLAAKFEETVSPAIVNFVQIADGAVSADDIRNAEQHILRTLDWDLSRYPSPLHFIRRISKADGYDPRVRALGKYLAEIVLVEHRLLGAPASLLAAAAMWLARLSLGEEGQWAGARARFAMYAEEDVLPVAGEMLRYVLRPIRHESFYRKWAGKRNMKASVYMREWALARWEEGTKVDLVAELPALKQEIRAHARKALAAREALTEEEKEGSEGDDEF
ncbi:cyclin-like protein [Mycena capillaripes]|nr:cyclin-like protein [Mycena capillaripes]